MSDQLNSAVVAGVVSLAINFGKWWLDHREKLNGAKAAHNLQAMLKADGWTKRSFKAIKERMGGYSDDELRRLLTSVGAVRFRRRNGEELSGLMEDN